MIPIDTLLTPVTEDQQVADITTTCVSLGTPADRWRQGGNMSTFRRVIARTYATLTKLLVASIGGAWIDTSAGGWLKRLALYVYGVSVPGATFATGQLTLTNGGGGIFSYGADGATFLDSTTRKTYTNVAPFTLGALSSLTIDIHATEAGAASTAPPGQIDTLQTAMLAVTCANADAIVGLDPPSDPTVKTFCRTTLGAASVRGPGNAYKFYAQFTLDPLTGLGVPLLNSGGTPVNINRVDVTTASHTGIVTVTVASPTGAPIGIDLTAADTNVQARAVPGGVVETTQGAVEVPYSAALTVWAQAAPGVQAATLQAACANAVALYLATYPIGGLTKGSLRGLFGTGIDGVLKATNDAIFAVDGATDLALASGQVATDATSVSVRLVKS